jgi:hypothetical protein
MSRFCRFRNAVGYLLIDLGTAIKCKKHKSHVATKLIFTAEFLDTHEIRKDIKEMILQDIQKVTLSITPVDAAGNPAKVDGAPVWESTDTTVVSLEVATDGLSAVATAVGPLGTAQVSVTADADLGQGITPLIGTLDIEVVASAAVSLNVTAGTPESK